MKLRRRVLRFFDKALGGVGLCRLNEYNKMVAAYGDTIDILTKMKADEGFLVIDTAKSVISNSTFRTSIIVTPRATETYISNNLFLGVPIPVVNKPGEMEMS